MSLLLAFIALLCAIGAHVALRRATGVGIVEGFVGVTAVGGLALLAALVYRAGPIAETISGLLIFAFGCELYLFLITFSLSSISANMLSRLLRGPVSVAELGRAYSGEEMAHRRVERLVGADLVEQRDEKMYLTRRGGRLVAVMSGLRWLFAHDRRTASTAR